MNDRAILNIDTIADADGVHITAQYGIEPDAAIVADDHIS